MRKRRLGLACALAVLLSCARAMAGDAWTASVDALPDDAWGRAVRLGRDLTVATPSLIGPEVADPAKRYAGNNLTCQNCHQAAGTAKFGLPFVGVFADFPQYRAREGGVRTIEDRIQGCMTRSMNGRALPIDSAEMRGFVAYLKFLSTGIAVGAKTPGRGTPELKLLDRPADPVRGAAVYARICAVCHGAGGAGQRAGAPGDARGYAYPPLWGPDSFNDGAGMARLIASASFAHANMPFGTTWENPALSEDDAWDAAAYVVSQPRPHAEGLERDFPNRLQKPVDAPYGPYPDSFPPEQHRFGPFQPIKDAVASLRAAAAPKPAQPTTGHTP